METVEIRSISRVEFIDITDRVQGVIERLDVSDGVCYVYVPHTTAGLTVNENADPSVQEDVITALERIIPRDQAYRHGEGNSPAHIKASIMGSSVVVFVRSNRLVLGTWQGIYFCEFDGPRNRRVYVTAVEGRP
ncbi:MAG: YjbQ family protein [Deltaproteobacteria bacterium]|nr:YjbQ family protein [Deltaproteobacteria bacterium]